MKGGKGIPALRLTPAWLQVLQRLHREVGKEVSSSRGSPPLSIAPVPPSPLLADAAAARRGGRGGEASSHCHGYRGTHWRLSENGARAARLAPSAADVVIWLLGSPCPPTTSHLAL